MSAEIESFSANMMGPAPDGLVYTRPPAPATQPYVPPREINTDPNTPTIEAIRNEIDRNGGLITFGRYQEIALAGPDGYYSSGRARVNEDNGDFVTSAQVKDFADRIIDVHQRYWRAMGDVAVRLVEHGAGRGELMKDSFVRLRQKNRAQYDRTSGVIVDFEGMRRRQEFTMAGLRKGVRFDLAQGTIEQHFEDCGKMTWVNESSITAQYGPVVGSIVTHEHQDAFGVEVARNQKGKLQQKYVTLDENRKPVAAWGPLQADVAEYINGFDVAIEEGKEVAVNLAAVRWMENTASQLQQGNLLIIDYGWTAPPNKDPGKAVWTFPPKHDALDYPGELDLTSNVDFGALRKVGERCGLQTDLFVSQGDFWVITEPDLAYRSRILPGDTAETLARVNADPTAGPARPGLSVLIMSRNVSVDFRASV